MKKETELVAEYLNKTAAVWRQKGVEVRTEFSAASGRPQFIRLKCQNGIGNDKTEEIWRFIANSEEHVVWVVSIQRDTVFLNVNSMHSAFGLPTIEKTIDKILDIIES